VVDAEDGVGSLALVPVVTARVRLQPHRQALPWILGGQRVQSSADLWESAVRAVEFSGAGSFVVVARRWHVLGFSADGKVAYYLTRRAADAAELQQPLEDLGVWDAVALKPTDDDRSRLWLLERSDGAGDLEAVDLLAQETVTLREMDRRSTRLVLTAAEASPRAGRMRIADVELTRRERRRQERLRGDIKSLRKGLRDVANRKYRNYIEKVKLRRESKSGVKEWDGD
jgi:hypothetical protein